MWIQPILLLTFLPTNKKDSFSLHPGKYHGLTASDCRPSSLASGISVFPILKQRATFLMSKLEGEKPD